jgi:hypothetical protein
LTQVPTTERNARAVEVRGVVVAIFAVGAALSLAATHPDPDLWGHLRFGLDWWRTMELPFTDPYSFTQDKPWINHEWLSEAGMGAAYLAGGVPGLVLMKMTVMGGTLAVLARRLRGATPVVTSLVLSLCVACALPISLTVRPQLWSVLFLALLAAVMDRERAPELRTLVLAAALFALWANFHGGWITGAAAMIVYCGMRALGSPADAWRWAAFAGTGVLGTLLNPYGVGLWRFLATTVRSSRPDITEWAPMTLDSPFILWVPILAATILPVALSVGRTAARPSPAVWATLAVLVAAALRVHRVAPLMGPAVLVLLAPCIVRRWGSLGTLRVPDRVAAALLWLPVVVGIFAIARPVATSLACLRIDSDWTPDLRAAGALVHHTGRLVTTFDWGEYSLWHFGPALKVSIDGRRETVYSDRLVQLHRRFEEGDREAIQEMLTLNPDYVWLPSSKKAVRDALAERGYRIDVETSQSFIAVRAGAAPLDSGAPALGRCFP